MEQHSVWLDEKQEQRLQFLSDEIGYSPSIMLQVLVNEALEVLD